jgi:hypothetical protein
MLFSFETQIAAQKKRRKMTNRLPIFPAAVIGLLLMLSGCVDLPADPKVMSEKSLSRAEAAINRSDWERAYFELQGLFHSSEPSISRQAKELIAGHPEFIKTAEAETKKRAHAQAEFSINTHKSEADYLSAMQSELDDYNIIDQNNHENLLRTVRDIYRKTVPTDFPAKELKPGMSRQDVIHVIGRPPLNESAFMLSSSQESKVDVLEYTFYITLKPGEKVAAPLWLAFFNSRLLKIGIGSIEDAEYQVFEEGLLRLARSKQIKYADSARVLATKYLGKR